MSHPPRGGYCDDQPHAPLERLCQRLPLQLGTAQLGLDVDQPPLNLDVDDLVRPDEQQICTATIPGRNRRLQAEMPARMCPARNGIDEPELAAVTQRQPGCREEAQGEIVPGRRGEGARDIEGGTSPPSLDEAYEGLTQTDLAGQLRLGQSGGEARDAQLTAEAGDERGCTAPTE